MNILVTGANRGLGLSLIKIGLENGHHMIATVRNLEVSKTKHLQELQKMYNDQLDIIQLDVSNEGSVKTALDQVKVITNSLDCIINNAGLLNGRGGNSTIEELDIEAYKDAFDINT